ncbi:hypothetical protein HGM15179_021965, partial [Zosterops borbonicus]
IIGGWEVKPHSRPYMAYLHVQNGSMSFSCGGFLIQCSQQRIHVRHWVIHPKYSRDTITNDIALLKLESNAWINKDVQLISIPRRNEHVRAGAECEVAGWGRTSLTGNGSNVMREVKLKVQKETICQQVFRSYQPQSMICVGDDYHKKGSYK